MSHYYLSQILDLTILRRATEDVGLFPIAPLILRMTRGGVRQEAGKE
jgi:hypothetical protein